MMHQKKTRSDARRLSIVATRSVRYPGMSPSRAAGGRWRFGMMATAVLLVASVAHGQGMGLARQEVIDFSDRVVTFETSDGITIEADYYPVKVEPNKKTPVAILIHMYPADRSSWKSLVPALRKTGVAALAYDIRGKGGSNKPVDKKLKDGYDNRDPAHFKDAWKDVEAARTWLGKQENIDVGRTILIGASIGCSIALEQASLDSTIKGVVCLSPGENYMGVDSIAHIKKCSTVPILLLSPEGEFEALRNLVKASGGRAKARKYPGGREHHGTGMLEAEYGKKVRGRILRFVRKHLDIESKKKADKTKKQKAPKAS